MDIVFVRHAEKEKTDGDVGLSQKGVEQAENLAKRFVKEKFDEIHCSGLKRAIQTAEIISKKIKIKPSINLSLNEFESNILKIEKDKWDENAKSQYNKLRTYLDSLTNRKEENKRILIIAHGITNRIILAILLDLEMKNLIRFRLLETAVSEVYWASKFKNWRLKYWGDTFHLPDNLIQNRD